MEIIATIFNIILGIVFLILKIILAPIDALISAAFPGISSGLTAIGQLIGLITQGLGFAISASGIPYAAIALIATYYIFKLTIPLNIWLIKLGVKWYVALKP